MTLHYVYTIIRKDIPLADQIVQACHAAYEAGEHKGRKGEEVSPFLILLEVQNEKELIELNSKLGAKAIPHVRFFEPDIGDGEFTSICTGRLDSEQRKIFSNLKLWRP